MNGMMSGNKIVIGIDQSYADSGIAVAFNGKIKSVSECKPKSTATNTEVRNQLRDKLAMVFSVVQSKQSELDNCDLVCIIERIRLQSAKPGMEHFLNLPYIKGIGALNAVIVDLAAMYSIPVYSVDTRSWKSRVVGTSSPGKNPYGFPEEKWPTIKWCIENGYGWLIAEEVSPRKIKGVIEKDGERWTYNDNKADSIGIALYGFVDSPKLEVEK